MSTATAHGIKVGLPGFVSGQVSLYYAINERKSIRAFLHVPLALWRLSSVLVAGTKVPSAGGIRPMVLYVVAEQVEDLEAGFYRYLPSTRELELLKTGHITVELGNCALRQEAVIKAPANIIVAADYEKTRAKYGNRAERFVHMEAGHIGQNISLQAVALNLGTVMIGAFMDRHVQLLLNISESPLYIIPIGAPA